MTWYNTDKNIAIFGGTQQGKSVLANEIYMHSDRIGVFFNPDGENFVGGWVVKDVNDIIYGMSRDKRKFSFEMPWYSLKDEEKYDKLVRFMIKTGENNNIGWILVTDEAQDYSPEGSRQTSLHLALKRGLKRGVQNVITTQDPATLSNSAFRQCDLFAWVGPMAPQDISYFKERLKIDLRQEKQPGKYEYMVFDRSGDIISRGKTKSKYA